VKVDKLLQVHDAKGMNLFQICCVMIITAIPRMVG